MCWGGSTKNREIQRLDQLIRKAGSNVGLGLDHVEKVVETLSKIRATSPVKISGEKKCMLNNWSHQTAGRRFLPMLE